MTNNGDGSFTVKAKTGYKFDGWYENGKKVSSETKYRPKASDAIPKFKAKKYTIKYKLGGGRITKGKVKKYTFGKGVSAKKLKAIKLKGKKGKKFKGWYRDKKLKKRLKRIGKKSAKKITLYAKWR